MPETNDEEAQEGRVWACKGCGRVGTSAEDLLRQGCEGKPEPYVPESALRESEASEAHWRDECNRQAGWREEAEARVARLEKALRKISRAGPYQPPLPLAKVALEALTDQPEEQG